MIRHIVLNNISKKYGFRPVFSPIDTIIHHNTITGIAGKNGSGKSTLVKMLAGFLTPSTGTVTYWSSTQTLVPSSQIFKYTTLATPYTELILDFTLAEILDFHVSFKPFVSNVDIHTFEDIIHLHNQRDKKIGHFSSGMRQKLMLSLAILSQSSILLLDEPTSYLDDQAKEWFYQLLNTYKKDRIVIMASNEQQDLSYCDSIIRIV